MRGLSRLHPAPGGGGAAGSEPGTALLHRACSRRRALARGGHRRPGPHRPLPHRSVQDTMWLPVISMLAWEHGLLWSHRPLSAAEAARRIRRTSTGNRRPDAARRRGGISPRRVVTSPIDIPAHTNSAMDGYAVRGKSAEPIRRAPTLEVVEQIPAGHFPVHRLEPGQASRIFTGAALPVRTRSSGRRTPIWDANAWSSDRIGIWAPTSGRPARTSGRAHCCWRTGPCSARSSWSPGLRRRQSPGGVPAASSRHPRQWRRNRGPGPA